VTRTLLKGETRSFRSVTNVGMRPTFNGAALTVETHLLDYFGEVKGKSIEVRFWKRLREEKKFAARRNCALRSPKTSAAPATFSRDSAASARFVRAPKRLSRNFR